MRIVVKFTTIAILLLLTVCSCASEKDKNNTQPTSSDTTAVASIEYLLDENYDTNIVGAFSKEDYTDHINHWKNFFEDEKYKSLEDFDNIEKRFDKNYGELVDAHSVKLAAIEVFYYSFDDNTASFSSVKVYYDENSNLWLAKKVEDWMRPRKNQNGEMYAAVSGSHYVLFDANGTLLALWQEQ